MPGGRPKGSVGPAAKIALKELKGGKVSPLEMMLNRMRELWDDGEKDSAVKIAAEAAPYMHARLQSVQAKVDNIVRYVVDSKPAQMPIEDWAVKHGEMPPQTKH